jgi:aryl sulfotransferase
MSVSRPVIEHIYQNHSLDSTRWNHFAPRHDDIIVATPYKSGTTWMQTIVLHLIFQDLQAHAVDEFSPWLDSRLSPLDETLAKLEAQAHRRCVKSHLPLDGLVYFPQVKYILVGRDARDVFMSLWNHHANYQPETYEFINTLPGRVGEPFPPCPDNIRDFWREWITRGWFPWEREGYPYWSNLRHVQTWWAYRALPNILLVHYNDLLKDLAGEIRRVADYVGIELPGDRLTAIANLVEFTSMKQEAEKIMPNATQRWKGGAQTFIHQGTNGRWRSILTDADLELYRVAVARELTSDCAFWLENGRL